MRDYILKTSKPFTCTNHVHVEIQEHRSDVAGMLDTDVGIPISALSGLTIQQILDLDVENLAVKIDKHHCQTKKAVLVSLIVTSQKNRRLFCILHNTKYHISIVQESTSHPYNFAPQIFLPESASLLCHSPSPGPLHGHKDPPIVQPVASRRGRTQEWEQPSQCETGVASMSPNQLHFIAFTMPTLS